MMNRLEERLKKVETGIRKRHEGPKPIEMIYVTHLVEDMEEAELRDEIFDVLKKRSRKGYDRRFSLPDDRGWELRKELAQHPDPEAFVESLSEDEFAGMMNRIGFFLHQERGHEPSESAHR